MMCWQCWQCWQDGVAAHRPAACWSRGRIVLVAAAWLIALEAFPACKTQAAGVGCQVDDECDVGFLCNQDSGLCQCSTDDVCGAGGYCNSFGACQTRPPCLGNKDCAAAQLCDASDPSGGVCIEKTGCGSSVHCAFGEYCDPAAGRCVPGCRNTGDCRLGDVCQDGTCVSGGTASDCALCPTRPTPDPAYCDYGEICGAGGRCAAHPQAAKLCQRCGITAMAQCAAGLMCLVDTDTNNQYYCAPTCQTDADCPSGYGICGGLALQGEDCTSSGRCLNGGVCLGGAESNRRSCSCVSQMDCTTGLVCRSGACVDAIFGQQAGLPCSSNHDCEATCEFVTLGDGQNIGNCILNQRACGKEAGVTCEDLQGGASACRAPHGG